MNLGLLLWMCVCVHISGITQLSSAGHTRRCCNNQPCLVLPHPWTLVSAKCWRVYYCVVCNVIWIKYFEYLINMVYFVVVLTNVNVECVECFCSCKSLLNIEYIKFAKIYHFTALSYWNSIHPLVNILKEIYVHNRLEIM
jgi:hypothetical protein